MSIVDFANDILMMENELRYLRIENDRLAEIEIQYNQLLRESMQHSEQMMYGLLQVCLVPGVTRALAENAAALTEEGK